jgi:hypothetical protein
MNGIGFSHARAGGCPFSGDLRREKEGGMFRDRSRAGLAHIGQALREPETFTLRWHREPAPYAWWVFVTLGLAAVAGTLSYGLTLGILGGGCLCWRCCGASAADGGLKRLLQRGLPGRDLHPLEVFRRCAGLLSAKPCPS